MQNHEDLQVSARTDVSSPVAVPSSSTSTVKRDLLEPYIPPNVPHGLPHVVRFATLSSMDLPVEARFLIVTLARYADQSGMASVALDTLCAICRIGSHHTVTRYITMAEEIGILQKIPGQGGKDRQSNKYLFMGEERRWRPLPVGHPDDNPIIILAAARRHIEELETQVARIPELEAQAALVEELQAELARLRNGAAIGHAAVTDGGPRSLEESLPGSYETDEPGTPGESDGAIRHSGVTDGESENHPGAGSHSYETPAQSGSRETSEAIRHSGVTDGSDEGQEYLARHARVEELVMRHQAYYERSFDRRGSLGAIEYFSRSAENEEELLRQVRILDAGQEPRAAPTGTSPPEPESRRRAAENAERYAVGQCPDCGKPYATYGGAEYCTDCTDRRRRESEA